ncbi:FRE7 [[Candida] subhashii]|uniref:FRE7 n=1 Tax=[Candida] subhashii TaxID=561895 RepID=A0A8J5QE80_9ASCO|nr:FRE7 [[Candida] subhashii]KAG7664394.1 FRE7 [[Candida] subhashii]
MDKRDVIYQGLDCIKDSMEQEYMTLGSQSQAAVKWAAQADYALYTAYFGVATIFVAFVKHLYYRFRDYRYKNRQTSNVATSIVDVLISYCRFIGYKQVPARIRFFTSLPNSVGGSLYVSFTSLYLLCYCLVPHFWYRECRGFGSPPLAVRAGLMATALTPFIYVLAGKSNAITLLTGMSYEKLNVYHQFVGVAAFVLSLIHTIPFLYQDLREGGNSHLFSNFQTQFEYYSGIPPLIFLGLLCTLSKSWVRKHVYEFFLHSHWMFGIAYFGTLIWHINKSLGADNYMWGALGFWATQILYRILMKTCFKPTSMFLRSRDAVLRKLGENVYEVTIANTKGYTWTPGQHCFLRFVGGRILDNHPFSIASMSSNESNSEMKFIIVPRKGLTRAHYLELDQHITTKKKVFIDGPYGGTFRDVTGFERVVLIGSGSGVTAIIPFLTYLANHISKLSKDSKPFVTEYINFVWIIRKEEHIDWIRDELLQCQKLAGDAINIQIYVSEEDAEKAKVVDDNKTEEKLCCEIDSSDDPNSTVGSIHEFSITYKKPSIPEVITSLGHTLSRRNIFISSGSDSMKEEVSNSVSKLQSLVFNNDILASNVEEIYLHTESFGW